MDAQIEAAVNAGGKKVEAVLVSNLQLMPNIKAETTPNQIQLTPDRVLHAYHIQNEGNAPQEEVRFGKAQVDAVCQLIRQELHKNKKSLGINFDAQNFFGTQMDAQILKTLSSNYTLQRLLMPSINDRDIPLLQKAIPQEIRSLIAFSVVNRMAEVAQKNAMLEAEKIDRASTAQQVNTISRDLVRIDQDIDQDNIRLQQTGVSYEMKEKEYTTATTAFKPFKEAKEQVVSFIKESSPGSPVDMSQLPQQIVTVFKKEGGLMGMGGTIHTTDHLCWIDEKMGGSDEALEKFGITGWPDLFNRMSTHYAKEHQKGAPALFDEAVELFYHTDRAFMQNINRNELGEQRKLLVDMLKNEKTREEGLRFATKLHARAMMLFTHTYGNSSISKELADIPDHMKGLKDFVRTIPQQASDIIEAIPAYKKAAETEQSAKQARDTEKTQNNEAKRIHESHQRERERKQNELNELTGEYSAKRRQEKLAKKMLMGIFAKRDGGRSLSDDVIGNIYESSNEQFFFGSQIATDAVKAVFDGMPVFLTADPERRQDAINWIGSVINNRELAQRQYKDYPDFMQQVADAVIDINHPTRENAIHMLTKLMEWYPSDTRELCMNGFSQNSTLQTQMREKNLMTAKTLMKSIVAGGKTIFVPQDQVPRADLAVLQTLKANDPRSDSIVKTTMNGLMQWIQNQNFPYGYSMMNEQRFFPANEKTLDYYRNIVFSQTYPPTNPNPYSGLSDLRYFAPLPNGPVHSFGNLLVVETKN